MTNANGVFLELWLPQNIHLDSGTLSADPARAYTPNSAELGV